MVKDVKYIYWVKKDLFGCFRIEGDNVTKNNATGLKEGGEIEMSSTVLSIYAIARSLSLLNLLTCNNDGISSAKSDFTSIRDDVD